MSHSIPHTVAELMTRDVITLTEEQDLQFLEETMHLFKFRHMPVTDDNKLVGLVTLQDVLRISASSLLPAGKQQTGYLQRQFKVRDIMTREVATVAPGASLVEAARLMRSEKFGCVPVVGEDNTLMGILTEADFVRFAEQYLTEHPSSPPTST